MRTPLPGWYRSPQSGCQDLACTPIGPQHPVRVAGVEPLPIVAEPRVGFPNEFGIPVAPAKTLSAFVSFASSRLPCGISRDRGSSIERAHWVRLSSRPQRRHLRHRTRYRRRRCHRRGKKPMPSTAAEKSRSGLSGCLFATSTNLYELPVEVVPQRVLDKSGRASKVVDGEVLKSGSEGINGLCKVGRSGGCSG